MVFMSLRRLTILNILDILKLCQEITQDYAFSVDWISLYELDEYHTHEPGCEEMSSRHDTTQNGHFLTSQAPNAQSHIDCQGQSHSDDYVFE